MGLKHDLEVGQSQWQETENIAPFELGVRDILDSFIIPEKLYGRQSKVETLLAAFIWCENVAVIKVFGNYRIVRLEGKSAVRR